MVLLPVRGLQVDVLVVLRDGHCLQHDHVRVADALLVLVLAAAHVVDDVWGAVEVIELEVNRLGEGMVIDEGEGAAFILDLLHEVELVLGGLVPGVACVRPPGVDDLGLLVLVLIRDRCEGQVGPLALVDESKLLEASVRRD